MTLSFRGFSAEAMTTYAKEESKILGSDHWRMMNLFKYFIGDKGSDTWVVVPLGYLTDGASVPRIFWNLIPPWGKYGQAAILHDYLCEFLEVTYLGKPKSITRKECDQILLEAMIVLGVPAPTRLTIYAAVSLYRMLSGVSKPTTTKLRRQLEAAWLKAQRGN